MNRPVVEKGYAALDQDGVSFLREVSS